MIEHVTANWKIPPIIALALTAAIAAAPRAAAQDAAAQQGPGAAAYQAQCAECHGSRLEGSAHGPALTGSTFDSVWGDRSAAELVEYLQAEMPPGQEGQLGEETYRGIAALLLSSGEIDPAVLAAAGFGAAAAPQTGTTRFRDSGAPALTAVTDDLLSRPPAADWLSWRRTRDNQGYSPLDQITRANAGELELAWVLSMREGQNQTTPLVHDGVMFLANPGNVVQAIDAATGDLIWEYRYGYPPDALKGTGATRGLALYGDKVFLAAYDASIIAIDMRTGEQVWQTTKVDYTQGFTHTSAPVIANGVVVSGINGCEQFTDAGCFITGHDPDTGEELWRTSTIAQPGDPNNDSWGDIPPHLRGGADMWIPGAYDAGPGPLLHRDRAGQALGGRQPRHVDDPRRALHELDAGAQPADRTGAVVLPARAGRDARPRQRVRTHVARHRRRAPAADGRQGRPALEAEPRDRTVSRHQGDGLPGRLRVDRPRDGAGHLPAGHPQRTDRRTRAGLSGILRRPQLDGVGLQPRDRRGRLPAGPGLHDDDRPAGRAGGRQRQRGRHRPAAADAGDRTGISASLRPSTCARSKSAGATSSGPCS